MKRIILATIMATMLLSMASAQASREMEYTPEQTTFRLFAPNDAKSVKLRLYQQGMDGKPMKTIKMQKTGNELWTASVKGNLMGKFYTFDMGKGECPGVFAKAVGTNGKRAAIIDLTLSLEHGHLLEQVIAGLCVGHLAEVVLEFLEDTTFSGCIPLEVVTLAELFYSCFLFLR